jgi:serine/threonine-protein kinase
LLLRLAIAKSLEKLPSRRYQTAAQMLQSLELVQAILEVDPNPQTPVKVPTFNFTPLVSTAQTTLDYPVSHLAIAPKQVFLVSGDRLVIQRHQDPSFSGKILEERKIVLNQPIKSLQLSSTGCLITTASAIYYLAQNAQNTDLGDLLPLATFEHNEFNESNELIATIDPQGSWLAVAFPRDNSGKSNLAIYKLPNCKLPRLQRSLISNQEWQSAIALDRQYGLGIQQNSAQNTKFQLFNRRGNSLANFTIQIRLNSVVYNPLFPYRLLATEVDNPGMVILITLKKFNLKRIPLEISPVIIQPCPQGYLIGDRQGKIILLDHDGECIGRFKVPLSVDFKITAIAVSTSEILVASASSSRSQLQQFSCLIDYVVYEN